MKKIVAVLVFVMLLITTIVYTQYNIKATPSVENNLQEKSNEELYQDIFITLLLPEIQNSVIDYYGKFMKDIPEIDPYHIDVLSAERPHGYRTYEFLIKLKITPYVGAHNLVGVDNLTLRVTSSKVKVEKFEHLETYKIP